MAAYDMLLMITREYFFDLGYDKTYVDDFFSPKMFKELISIQLANTNVVIKNKTDNSSHQSHIAITGETIDFFYSVKEFSSLDTDLVDNKEVSVSVANISDLNGVRYIIKDTKDMEIETGKVTVGKRTQNQLQLSKRNRLNSECFNKLRNGLYENDLLMMFKYRNIDRFLAIGIPQRFYLDYIPDYAQKYGTHTYLRMPYSM